MPQESVLEPTATERVKLATLDVILAYHERLQVYAIKVIDVPVASVNWYPPAVVLISRPALRLLSVPELQATVAHEIGHEYFSGTTRTSARGRTRWGSKSSSSNAMA